MLFFLASLLSAQDRVNSGAPVPAATTEKEGFLKAIGAGTGVNLAPVMVGAVDQTIEVTPSAPMLELQGTNLGKVPPTKAIRDLPLFISGGLLDGQSEQLDAVVEGMKAFKVQSSSYSAEFGRTSNGVINRVKSGTNTVHGSAFAPTFPFIARWTSSTIPRNIVTILAGQVIGGLMLSHFGWLGSPFGHVTANELVGVAL